MFIPTANGTSPSMVAVAVKTTGVTRVSPALTIASLVCTPLALNTSVNSTIRIPFRTTIPPSATIPIPVIIMEIDIPKIMIPSKTPMMLKITSLRIITDLLSELNCDMRIKKINGNKHSFCKESHRLCLIFLLTGEFDNYIFMLWK